MEASGSESRAARAAAGGDATRRGEYDDKTMSRRTARAVGALLLEAMPQLADRLTELRLKQSWRDVVGPEIARRSQPRSLVDGCVSIVVDNSPWLHELTLRQTDVTARVRAAFPAVRSVRVTLGTLATDPAPVTEAAARAVTLTSRDLREIDEATSTIGDPTLAAAARQLMTRARQFPGARGAAR